nr:ribonuclease H-like domain-containing protein [Tanacetum cinerariifolium]
MLHMGDQSTDEYFWKIESLVTLLSDLGSDVSKDDVVTYAINGLSDKYGSLAQIIAHKDPFPDLATMRSMVNTEEMRLRSKSPIQPTNMNASAPQVLLAASNISRGGDNHNTRNRDNRKPNTCTEVCRNFGRGFFHWGDSFRFVHDSNCGTGIASQPNAYSHETYLPQALNTMTLQEHADLNWNMDTGASSYLNSSTTSSKAFFQRIITSLYTEFSMTDLGPLNYFLVSLSLVILSGCFSLNRSMQLSLAGALHYLTFTRPDISYTVQQVCLFMHDPREPYFSALKRILRYVRSTLSYGLQLYSSTTSTLVAYLDADWAGCSTTRRSTSGYCIFLGNNLLSWSSKRQFTISRSSAEVEYRGVANAVAETRWLRNLLRELHTPLSTATLVYCDNVSAVYLSSNPVQYQRTKHIEIDIHFVRDLASTGRIRVLHIPSHYQLADYFVWP